MFDVKDLILEGIAYTIMGMIVVFVMLIIIMYVIKAMQFFSGAEETEKDAPAQAAETQIVSETVEAQAAPQKSDDDSELIAVITAAIMASMGKSSSGLVIKSYKKLSGEEWNKIGRREVLDNRF